MMFTAYKGFKYIVIISWVSMPLYLLAIALAVVLAVQGYSGGLGALMSTEISEVSFDYAVYRGVSLYAGFSVLMCDVSRFVKNRAQLSKGIIIGYLLSALIPICGVILGAAVGGEYWIVFASYGLLFGIFATIAFFLAQWTTNDNNAFASGLALATITGVLNRHTKGKVPYISRSKCTLVPIFLGVLLAFLGTGAISPLLGALNFLGDWLPTMAGIIIVHYFIIERLAKQPVQCKGIAAILAYLPSSLLCQFNILPWKAVTGILIAMVLYIVFYFAIEAPILRVKEVRE
jgi:cytosine permease